MSRRVEAMMWVGVFGAPIAWAAAHVGGWMLSEANCEVAGRQWGIAFDTWVGAFTGVAAVLAILGLVSAGLAYRAVSGTDKDAPGPNGRIWLMSIAGLVVSSLMIVLIGLTGSGALLLSQCHQA